jgi:threonine/homoserine/homoserine lactone efflux protein
MIVVASVFAIFIPALMLPGPDFAAVVRSSMVHGALSGLMTSLGVSFGLGLYATLSLLGLSAILVEYQWLAWAIRVLGGCYLVCLGLRLVLTRHQPVDMTDIGQRRRGNPLLFGFLVTLTNPKAIVLFTSVFATAVTESTPFWLMGLMIGLVFCSSLVWYAIVSAFMASDPVISRLRRSQHWIERAAGACFVAIGGRILADSRNPLTP